MPTENNSQIIEDNKRRIVDYVSEQIQHLDGCPVCHDHRWGVSGSSFVLQEVTPAGMTGNVLPVVVAFCRNCGYLMAFNAQNAGATEHWPFE